jgi:hypothetical protein
MIDFRNSFLDFLNFIVVVSGSAYFSRFIGVKINPSWLGYGLGFIVGVLGFELGAQLINFILVDWSNLGFVFFAWLRLVVFFMGFVGVSSVLAVLWHRTNHMQLETTLSAKIVWTITRIISSTTIGAIAGAIVAVIGVGLWVIVCLTDVAWDVIRYLSREMGSQFNALDIQLLVIITFIIVGIIFGAIGGAIGIRIFWQRSWVNIVFGAIGGAISGVPISTFGIAAISVIFFWD